MSRSLPLASACDEAEADLLELHLLDDELLLRQDLAQRIRIATLCWELLTEHLWGAQS